MNGVRFPDGWRIELLTKKHPRKDFQSGQDHVDGWFKQSAMQSQTKHLSTTKVLLNEIERIIGFYTLASSQVDFSELPLDLAKTLPKRQLPVAVIGWLGIEKSFHGKGIGKRLFLNQAFADCLTCQF
jgi:hypothetical protein